MKIPFTGLEIRRTKAPRSLQNVDNRGAWWPVIREPWAGAWQSNVTVSVEDVLTYAPVYACITLIARDIGKMRMKLVRQGPQPDVWIETENPAFSPVLRRPNHYQIRNRFLESWILSKLIYGNAYILKRRDARNVVTALYVLEPSRVKPLVAEDSSIYYELQRDTLSGLTSIVTVPAEEIIHDEMPALYHPLVGISGISAAGVPATQGLRIQDNSATFFSNGAQPGGILSAPGVIKQETADRLKAYWDTNFSGENAGKVAVLGDGLKYDAISIMSAKDAQTVEQLGWTAEQACTAFGVPKWKIGVGAPPPYGNYEAVKMDYYESALQTHVESIEELLDDGLGLKTGGTQIFGVELDVDSLLRMDTPTRVKAAADAVGSGTMTVNEARERYHGLPPVTGGDTCYLQQQNYSLEALAERDANDPFAKPTPATPAVPATDAADQPTAAEMLDAMTAAEDARAAAAFEALVLKSMAEVAIRNAEGAHV